MTGVQTCALPILALEAMKKSATWNHLGLPALMKKNYIEAEDEHESVSKVLDYSYDDWCIAQVSKLLAREDDYQYYMLRSQCWKNLFDPKTGHMRPRRNGGWHSPFDPREVNNYFTEGNSWQYSFFVPHDIEGLMDIMGGQLAFENKLDKLFSESSQTTGREQADITGLIGQYAHGNEPSHHMAYLYNYSGSPSKTQYLTTKILNELYKAKPDGLCGNEDCGQMSAWYILSSLGIYQVAPGSGFYDITLPVFDRSTFLLENGNTFTIQVMNPDLRSNEKTRIASVLVNGVSLNWTKLNYDKIMQGGKMEITLTDNPANYWGNFFDDISFKIVPDYKTIVKAPIIEAATKSFKDSLLVEIKNNEPGNFVIYKLFDVEEGGSSSREPLELSAADNSPQFMFTNYSEPFWIKKSQYVLAMTKPMGSLLQQSVYPGASYSLAHFHKIPNDWKIEIKSKYNPQYTAGGKEGIIDGLYADENWRKGGWQGYQSQDFECIIDLKKVCTVKELGANFLQDTRSWIIMPVKTEFSWSEDGKKFSTPLQIANDLDPKDDNVQLKKFKVSLPENQQIRYLKVKAYNYGKLPKWHQGFGGDAFIFIDEIFIH